MLLKVNLGPLSSIYGLAAELGMTSQELYARVYSKKYRYFVIPKRTGGYRAISAPLGNLIALQEKLAAILAHEYGRRSPVHGFARGRDIVTNAGAHLGAELILNFDLLDFFPSIHFGRVRGLLLGKPYDCSPDVAQVVARICCNQGVLPQGAPTSPIISNMVCGQLDAKLKVLARKFGCTYTRYADDITFSTRSDKFPSAIAERGSTGSFILGQAIRDIVHQENFQINAKKTRVSGQGGRKEVTGIVVHNDRLNVRRSYIRNVRCLLNYWEKSDTDKVTDQFLKKYDRLNRQHVDIASVIRGRLEHIGHVRGRDNEVYQNLVDRFLKLDATQSFSACSVTSHCDLGTLNRAVYILRGVDADGAERTSTGFWLKDVGLISAAHGVQNKDSDFFKNLVAFRISPTVDSIPLAVKWACHHRDLAILTAQNGFTPRIYFMPGVQPLTGDAIRLIGFPNWKQGHAISVSAGTVIRNEVKSAVHRTIITSSIAYGNSGGPVLDKLNRVIGVAIEGNSILENAAVSLAHLP